MIVQRELLPGVFIIQVRRFVDARGEFVKTFHEEMFREIGIDVNWQEDFFSVSKAGVLRGMHFQLPPHDHEKLVYCISGRILDVVLDLRKTSEFYGQARSIELSSSDPHLVFIPKGMAHGFLALEDDSIVGYKTTVVHHPESDSGIHWDSFGYKWPTAHPMLSARDASFEGMQSFDSAF